jgi:hypothetical protein
MGYLAIPPRRYLCAGGSVFNEKRAQTGCQTLLIQKSYFVCQQFKSCVHPSHGDCWVSQLAQRQLNIFKKGCFYDAKEGPGAFIKNTESLFRFRK